MAIKRKPGRTPKNAPAPTTSPKLLSYNKYKNFEAMTNILAKIFSTGAKELVGTVGNVIDNLTTSKEEKEAAKLAIQGEVNRHMEAMADRTLKEAELEIQDKGNARNREIELAKVTGHGDRMNWFLAIVVMSLLIFITIALVYIEIPMRNEHVIMLIIGEILGFAGGIFTYQFGSSFGSRLKDMRSK